MKFKCRVITRASRNEIIGIDELYRLELGFKNGKEEADLPQLRVYITAVPVDGKANKELIRLLSEVLNVSKSKINIIKGEKNKDKIIEVDDQI